MTATDNTELLQAARSMNDEQMRCFQMYVALGPERSLSKLVDVLVTREIPVRLRQLQRWSAQWKWSQLAYLTQRELAQKVADEAGDPLKALLKADMEAVQTLRERFHRRVKIDPFDPETEEHLKQFALMPSLDDYEKLLRIERILLGDPDDTARKGETSRVVQELHLHVHDSEIVDELKQRTRVIHGLPDPTKYDPNMRDVTHSVESPAHDDG